MIIDDQNRMLLQQRPEGKAHAGLWEFPGGKVEAGEIPGDSLIREIEEELGIDLSEKALHPIGFAESAWEDGQAAIVILLYRVDSWEGHPEPREGGALGWFTPEEAEALPMPPLDIDLFSRLHFKKMEP
ncbi:(deoxy)nucleoside triphosphate pyrophosphohydrolase [Croceicoccus estronivorus]|uniref:(deoxy)nucleoside triphosphate pyrophosphohydrolase n=1 Tax=Croceicoccus estronivorus TaxID=1172626 RepID=UPI001F317D27|nr:(deoxy)nucleoside triphosphate pyrophosphohydrolase [Croceicoccus estronivorus]